MTYFITSQCFSISLINARWKNKLFRYLLLSRFVKRQTSVPLSLVSGLLWLLLKLCIQRDLEAFRSTGKCCRKCFPGLDCFVNDWLEFRSRHNFLLPPLIQLLHIFPFIFGRQEGKAICIDEKTSLNYTRNEIGTFLRYTKLSRFSFLLLSFFGDQITHDLLEWKRHSATRRSMGRRSVHNDNQSLRDLKVCMIVDIFHHN